jgi:hypothetical protein
MPRTTDRIVDHDAIGQRPAVVRACCTDRQHVRAPPHEQDRLIADVPSHRHAVCQARQRDSLGKVRSAGL